MIKISMMSYTIARGEWGNKPDIKELCEFTRKIDIDAIDWCGTYGFNPQDIRRITDEYGLKNICYTFHANDIQYPSRDIRKKGIEEVKKGLEVASILGADKIMLPIEGLEGIPRAEVRKYCIESLAEAVELARNLSITVTVEHFPGAISPFVISADVNEAIREVPDLRITYDNGNVFTGGEEPAEGFKNSAEYIVHAHFKDWVVDKDGRPCLDGNSYKGALITEGLVDPVPCIKIMKEMGYDGYINFEYEGDKYSPYQATITGVNALREMLKD